MVEEVAPHVMLDPCSHDVAYIMNQVVGKEPDHVKHEKYYQKPEEFSDPAFGKQCIYGITRDHWEEQIHYRHYECRAEIYHEKLLMRFIILC